MKGKIKMSTNMIENPKIVSRDEWLAARKKLLAKERQLTHERDAIAAERRQLPWVRVEKNYSFDTPTGKKTLADLFDGRSQLIIYHFMFGPDWKEGCPSCSSNMDHTDSALVHLTQRDVSFAAISRATLPQDRKSTRLNSSHTVISYAVFCLKKKKKYLFTIRSENVRE